MITHVGGINAVADATCHLPEIPGDKKLTYIQFDMPFTAIDDFEELGKTPGKDVVAGKSTYPALLGLEKSHAILEESLNKAEAIFQNLAETQGFKKDSIIEIIERLRLHV